MRSTTWSGAISGSVSWFFASSTPSPAARATSEQYPGSRLQRSIETESARASSAEMPAPAARPSASSTMRGIRASSRRRTSSRRAAQVASPRSNPQVRRSVVGIRSAAAAPRMRPISPGAPQASMTSTVGASRRPAQAEARLRGPRRPHPASPLVSATFVAARVLTSSIPATASLMSSTCVTMAEGRMDPRASRRSAIP